MSSGSHASHVGGVVPKSRLRLPQAKNNKPPAVRAWQIIKMRTVPQRSIARPIDPATARELFASVPGVVVVDDPSAHRYPLATHAAGSDEVYVGRIRQDVSMPERRGLAFWVVSDNLRKGAATNAVQIAELVAERGWLEPASRRAAPTA